MADELDKAISEMFDGDTSSPQPELPPEPAKEPAVEPQPEPAQQPQPEEPKPEPQPEAKDHTVPLPKYLDLRDEVKELRRFKAEQEAKATPQAAPDPDDDPRGFAAHQEQQFQARLTQQKFEMSDVLARQAHKPEAVETALQWAEEKAKADPTFVAGYMAEPHPVDWIVRQHQRDTLVSQLPPDVSSLDELIERKIAERGLASAAGSPAVVPPAPTPAAPKPSLVNAPSGGGAQEVAMGTVAALDAVFPR